ncbi:cytochrome c oxidase accessory protein CcoG [Rubrivivax sp. JA1026]|uniref:cytochrome c oxidase accessory protein CcoG n=1 Tax=Rubrivivax sp. JA1026 TaxID=2710888 RepID=UPI0013E959E9|nr:cytochrome c oxidase accessory protein CcoG [Rubrivivax sp. JA1026]
MSQARADLDNRPVPASAASDEAPATAGAATEAVVSLYVKSKRIYARSVSGWFNGWRWALVWITQLVFYGLPWLDWNARQAVLFDLGARRFYIFGLVLYPQDLIYLSALLMISAYALFLFTAVAGRLWCGYACPQTVYTEIFMWVERRFEGDRNARMRLDAGPWNFQRLWRKSATQTVWILIALWTGLTFVGYFTPIRELLPSAFAFTLGPWETFWTLFYGFATWGNAGYMREQVCKYMCPYARFQSAMFDKDTLIVSYDAERGDPRGTRSRKVDARSQGLGDCIDCGLCVQVCPTGIDIRDGLQYECIGCTACIDVCNGVMDKMKYPRGLIRYATQNGMAQHQTRGQMLQRVFRPRVLVYTAILFVIVGAFAASLALRHPFRVDVVRDRASLARIVDDGYIENLYRLQVMNATESPQRYRVRAEGLAGMVIDGQPEFDVESAGARWVTIALRVPPQTATQAGPGAHTIQFHVDRLPDARDPSSVVASENSTFVVPR